MSIQLKVFDFLPAKARELASNKDFGQAVPLFLVNDAR